MNKVIKVVTGASAIVLIGSLATSNHKLKQDISDLTDVKNQVEQTLKDEQNKNSVLTKDIKDITNEYKYIRDILFTELNYNPNDITEPSGANVVHLTKALNGTKLQPLAPTFIQAEKDYGINAIALASLVANESAWGTSERAINDNNMTGYAVYHDDSRGVIFDSQAECILATAKLLKNDYVTSDSKHNTGTDIWNINKIYSSDTTWSSTINKIASDLIQKGEF